MEAALSLFAPLLPPRRARKLRKRLRRLRRAARVVRDCDVLLERLSGAWLPSASLVEVRPACGIEPDVGSETTGEVAAAEVIEALRCQRATAADALAPELSRFSGKPGKQRWRRLRDSLRWREVEPEPGFAEGLGGLASPALDALEQAGACDLTDVDALHRFRLAGKRARYTLELLRDATDAKDARELEEWLKGCQQQLGDINDHATAAELLNELANHADRDEVSRAAEKLAAQERSKLHDGAQRFAGWWRTTGRDEAARSLQAFRNEQFV
jgi:CHAD domain-containing protein